MRRGDAVSCAPVRGSSVPTSFGLAVRAAVVDAEGRVLLLRRSSASRVGAGEWEWPGGKLEPGERLEEALVREVAEECGLRVEPTRLVGAYEIELPGLRAVSVCFAVRVLGGAFALSEEHDAARWVAAADLPGLALVPAARDLVGAFVVAAAEGAAGAADRTGVAGGAPDARRSR